MAEEENTEEQEGEQEGASKKNNTTLYIIIGAVVLVLVIAGVLFAVLSGDKGVQDSEASKGMLNGEDGLQIEGYDDEDELDEDEEPLGAIFPMETFVVNLSGEKEYLRCQLQIEFHSREVPARFYTRLVPARDAIIEVIAARTGSELGASAGRASLKEDLKELINELLRKEDVKTIYFTQFVIQ